MKDTQRLIIFNLILIFCLTAFLKVQADTTGNTALSLKVAPGSLSVEVPPSAAFVATNFSFAGQTNGGNPIGNIKTTDARGSRSGWGINVTATDWTDSTGKVIKHNGDGANEGRLSLDVPTLGSVARIAGDDTTGITMGEDAPFTGSTSIKLITAPANYGSGQYDISGLNAAQFIPGNQPTGNYVTNLTLTIS